MDVRIEDSWKQQLQEEFQKQYFSDLVHFIKSEYSQHTIFPPGAKIFGAFDYCPFSDVRVVIIGQDPYHGKGQANGLCFSVADNVRIPPSLVNIFKELETDIGTPIPTSGNLERWARQGVLLLNATLTVRASKPGSHQGRGWEEFTDAVIRLLSEGEKPMVFILWGAFAQKKGLIIDESKHKVIKSPHPSPFSAHNGFFGSRPFSKTNDYLASIGQTPINW